MIYQINNRLLMDYRVKQLGNGIKASTINHDLAVLSGVFSVMIEVEEFFGEHPISALAHLKTQQTEMSYLSEDEIARLLDMAQVMQCVLPDSTWLQARDEVRPKTSKLKISFIIELGLLKQRMVKSARCQFPRSSPTR